MIRCRAVEFKKTRLVRHNLNRGLPSRRHYRHVAAESRRDGDDGYKCMGHTQPPHETSTAQFDLRRGAVYIHLAAAAARSADS